MVVGGFLWTDLDLELVAAGGAAAKVAWIGAGGKRTGRGLRRAKDSQMYILKKCEEKHDDLPIHMWDIKVFWGTVVETIKIS